MFLPVSYKGPRSGSDAQKLAGTAILRGAVLAVSTLGNVIPATSATVSGEVRGVSTEAVVIADARTKFHRLAELQGHLWVADTTNDSNEAHNEQRMVLTDSVTVNNTGTDDATGIVIQKGTVGAPADRKILVEFI